MSRAEQSARLVCFPTCNYPAAMQIVKSVVAMQSLAKKWQRDDIKIGFVPTMGYLHEGHLSLVKRARKAVGKNGKIIVSIYVNPTQFAPKEDFSKYPRDLKRDLRLLRELKVDAVFIPSDSEMYPQWGESLSSPDSKKYLGSTESRPTKFSTYVVEEKLSRTMEGAARPAHFKGVTTVVAKLFNIVRPDAAVFGQKDFQQATIIKRMVADLNFPVKIIVASTVRERDGLAMSSRNKYLSGDLRRQATILWRAIQIAQAAVKNSKIISAVKLKSDLQIIIEAEPNAKLDHVEFFEPETLSPVSIVKSGIQMALAVIVGKTRLIDNTKL
ncbi:MAG: pantoate--beta-alanine ligase [Limisphaerales bacterium]